MSGRFFGFYTVVLSAGLLLTQTANNAYATTEQGVMALRAGDFQAAYGYLRLEALAGDPIAQFSMCGMYFQGQGVPKNEYEAFKWCQLAADQGHLEATYNLALFYQKGTGVGQNMNQAMKWYQVAAERGHKDAQFNLLQLYNANLTDSARTNVGGAKLAAVVPPVGIALDQNGNPVNMNPLKAMGPAVALQPQQSQAGQPVPVPVPVAVPAPVAIPAAAPVADSSRAFASVAAAPSAAVSAAPQVAATAAAPVAQGVAQAAVPAAVAAQAAIAEPIQMAPVEDVQAASIPPRKPMTLEEQKAYNIEQGCLQAAQKGIFAANCDDDEDKPTIPQVKIAQVVPTKPVVAAAPANPADVQNTIGWFEKQAELGDLAAQNNLGVMYRRGMGVEKQPAKAFELFQKSAARGSPNGMLNLANMYKLGEGTDQNLELSYAWYNLAADRIPAGEMKKSALANIKEISGFMDNQQIGNALEYVTKLDESIPLAE